MIQNHPEHSAEDRLQPENDRRLRLTGMLLADPLHDEPQPERNDTRGDRVRPARIQSGHGPAVNNQPRDQVQHRGHDELPRRVRDHVVIHLHALLHAENMPRPAERAREDDQIPDGDTAEALAVRGEQIQADEHDSRRQPMPRMNLPPEQNPGQERDDDDVRRRDEGRVPDGDGLDPELLQQPAEINHQSRQDRMPKHLRLPERQPELRGDRHEHRRGGIADKAEAERRGRLRPDLLTVKTGSPYHRGNKEHQVSKVLLRCSLVHVYNYNRPRRKKTGLERQGGVRSEE